MRERVSERIKKRTHKKGWREKGKEAAKYSPIPWQRQRRETETETETAARAWIGSVPCAMQSPGECTQRFREIIGQRSQNQNATQTRAPSASRAKEGERKKKFQHVRRRARGWKTRSQSRAKAQICDLSLSFKPTRIITRSSILLRVLKTPAEEEHTRPNTKKSRETWLQSQCTQHQ